MKMKYILIALAAVFAINVSAKSPKRGVSENKFSLVSQLEALEPGVTWYYNWGNTPGTGYDGVNKYDGVEFVPMCWNASYSADNIRAYCKEHPNTKYLLGFNEPNFTAQANMTPQQAAEAWPAVKALADELGLKLVAPALNYSPNPPYTDPLKWMDEFVALVGIDAFDFTAIHNYGGLGVMQTLAGNFHDRYGKPVWVTEFCYWPEEGNANSTVSMETQIQTMVKTLEWLETTEWIYRYAWFKAVGNYNASKGPNYGLVKQIAGALDPWGLTPQGKAYVNLGTFDQNVWHNVGETVPAVEYGSADLIGINETGDAACPKEIEISSFNGGASITWQFNVKEAGKHVVTLNVSGYGEPTRFDPNVQWMMEENGKDVALTNAEKFELPNSDTEYKAVSWTVDLPAGNVKLKLVDKGPYQPSGIKFSTIRVDNLAGVDEILGETSTVAAGVYNLQGIKVADSSENLNSLPKGLYIVDGKKVFVR